MFEMFIYVATWGHRRYTHTNRCTHTNKNTQTHTQIQLKIKNILRELLSKHLNLIIF